MGKSNWPTRLSSTFFSRTRTNKLFAELTQLPIVLYTGSGGEEADQLAKRIRAQIVRKDEPLEVLEAAISRIIGTRKEHPFA